MSAISKVFLMLLRQNKSNLDSNEIMLGAKATFPLIVGAIPFGILFGTLAAPSGLSVAATIAMSVFVFAGSAQFISLGLLAAGAPLEVIVATTFVVNLRHALYAANLVPHVRKLSQKWRIAIGFGLTDETFAAVTSRMVEGDIKDFRSLYLGSWLAMYGNWILCTIIGILLGELIPDMTQWGLDFAMVVTFIGMVAPHLIPRKNAHAQMISASACWIAVLVAAVVSVLAADMPNKLGLMAAALAGLTSGMLFVRFYKPAASSKSIAADNPDLKANNQGANNG
ncbi:AzlC family ABC transporter permease [Pelagibaculum spongiae]|nr:AzlC family ABC transporter permease [Pelagibaculum spongiae]